MRLNHHAGVDACEGALGRDGLRQALGGVGFFIEPLPLQIAGLHVVAVDENQRADARAGQRGSVKTTQRTATHHRDARRPETLLALLADAGKQNLARVALALLRSHSSPS